MGSRTHLLIAMLFGWLFFRYFPDFSMEGKFLFSVFLIFGALFPDIDNPNSELGRKHKMVSSFFRHRGFFHSVWIPLFILVISFSSDVLFPPLVGFSIGYFSHLFADIFTVRGLRLFSPFLKTRIKGVFKTGGLAETIISVLIVMFFLVV